MNGRMPKLPQTAISAALAILFSALVPLSTVFADSLPYFTTQNAGPFAGGGFNSGTSTCTGANYQSPFTESPPDYYEGAIMGWANLGNRPGASSNLDGFATGLIEGPDSSSPNSPDYGFYTGLPTVGPAPNGSRSLSFANSGPSVTRFWGGVFEGGPGGQHCIPDYYGTKQGSTGATTAPAGNFAGRTVAAGTKLLVFVNGNVNITGNIIYGSNNISNAPQFALIARGNIYISPSVARLDGWYIAQPTSGTTGGVIWTCSNGTEPLPDTYIRNTPGCSSRLTINGALTAKQVNLSRIGGNLGGDSAEDVNFSAAMVLRGPFFDETTGGGGSSNVGAIQSLISLPPVF